MVLAITSTLVALQLLGMVSTVYIAGQPRKPITPGGAAATLILGLLFIAGILYLAHA